MSNEIMLTGLLDQAMATLANAKTAAEILDAGGRARVAFETAKAASKLKTAHDTVRAACHRVMADALQIEVAAQCRLADEFDAAQERGELPSHGGDRKSGDRKIKILKTGSCSPTLADMGINGRQFSRARQTRNAEQADPGVIKRTLDAVLQTGKQPRRADIDRAVKETLEKAEADARPKKRPTKYSDEVRDKAAKLHLDMGMPVTAAAAEAGMASEMVAKVAIAKEEGRREVEAQLDPSTLPKSAQERLEAFKRTYQKQLDNAFEARVLAGIKERIDEMVLPFYSEKEELYDAVVKAYKGLMPREDYRKVLACLHPDSRRSVSDERLAEAFGIIKKLEKLLVSDAETRPAAGTLPKTYDELMERKRQAQKAKRNGAHA